MRQEVEKVSQFLRVALEVGLRSDEAASPLLGQLLGLALSAEGEKKERGAEEEASKSERESIRVQRSICAKQ